MPAQPKQMIGAIEKILLPILREKNFKGTFPDFFREKNGHIDLLSFQFNKYGGSFAVNISYANKERNNITPYSGKDVPPEKLTAYHGKDRLRLGSKPILLFLLFRREKVNGDHWFRYKENFFSRRNVFENAAKEVIPYLENQAEEWWRSKYIS